jgi:F420-dependent oxidoreductase-like protein
MDHLIQIPGVGQPEEPFMEGWTVLAALAAVTEKIRLATLVTSVAYRNPALLAKMAAGVDIISGGRLTFGFGAGWYYQEYGQYGYEFPESPSVRIRQMEEALKVIKLMWSEPRATFYGKYFHIDEAILEPKPLQKPHPPIMIGGGGEKKTLRVAAKHANQWNTFGSPEVFRRKISVLKEHCASVRREPDDIEISWAGSFALTGSAAEKERTVRSVAEWYGAAPEAVEPGLLVGAENEVKDRIRQFIDAGVTHFILSMRSPFDLDAIRGFADRIIPEFRGAGHLRQE